MRQGCKILVCLATLLALSGCYGETEAELPAPLELTRDAVGHYCGMIVADHSGPKAQIFVADRDTPVWFASVRDAFAFMMLPGEAKNVRAIFVNDMGKSSNWHRPEPGTWIDARKAYFVIDSARRGGMGLDEAVPFSNGEAAGAFTAEYGGHVVSFSKVPSNYVLGDGSASSQNNQSGNHQHDDHQHDSHHGPVKKGGES